LDYSSYAAEDYQVNLGSLVEDIVGDVTNLVAGMSNVKTLHLSADSLEVFHSCCKSIPLFPNLVTLSFESDKERGW
ncbi:hypothetical protein ARALYDRAFT_478663, partial [Arabidopsis lyrata subsp. lyrata]